LENYSKFACDSPTLEISLYQSIDVNHLTWSNQW